MHIPVDEVVADAPVEHDPSLPSQDLIQSRDAVTHDLQHTTTQVRQGALRVQDTLSLVLPHQWILVPQHPVQNVNEIQTYTHTYVHTHTEDTHAYRRHTCIQKTHMHTEDTHAYRRHTCIQKTHTPYSDCTRCTLHVLKKQQKVQNSDSALHCSRQMKKVDHSLNNNTQ